MKKFVLKFNRGLLARTARGLGCESGVALIEFALVLPILMIMLLGGIEVSRMVLFNQKIENATAGVADMVTRLDYIEVPCSELSFIRNSLLVEMMRPYQFNENGGGMIVSSIEAEYPDPDNPNDNESLLQRVIWQWNQSANASRIGSEGGLANGAEWPFVFRQAPNQGGMYEGDRIIAVELFYTYRTLVPGIDRFVGIDAVTEVYKKAFYRARFGNMSRLQRGC